MSLPFGILTALIKDPDVMEIMVNNHETIYYEKNGKLHRAQDFFNTEKDYLITIQALAAFTGNLPSETNPIVDARLSDGSRVHIIMPPVAQSPAINIRKFPHRMLMIEDLLKLGALSPEIADYLDSAIKNRLNILVSGGTGSGKTTLLNALVHLVDDEERIIAIADSGTLRINKPHLVMLEGTPPNFEGKGGVNNAQLIASAMKMRPERIIVSELNTAAETNLFIQALQTGHDGGMTSLHANSPRDAFGRMEILLTAHTPYLPLSILRAQLAESLDVVVQIQRLNDGVRRVVAITEVMGVERDQVVFHPLFEYVGDTRDGNFVTLNTSAKIR
ncbi:MAG: ATPase, T2SS/T4P/T4SS family [bacterium]|nr:ATPase, T2SS/T4P/T4SS family [bacterium]